MFWINVRFLIIFRLNFHRLNTRLLWKGCKLNLLQENASMYANTQSKFSVWMNTFDLWQSFFVWCEQLWRLEIQCRCVNNLQIFLFSTSKLKSLSSCLTSTCWIGWDFVWAKTWTHFFGWSIGQTRLHRPDGQTFWLKLFCHHRLSRLKMKYIEYYFQYIDCTWIKLIRHIVCQSVTELNSKYFHLLDFIYDTLTEYRANCIWTLLSYSWELIIDGLLDGILKFNRCNSSMKYRLVNAWTIALCECMRRHFICKRYSTCQLHDGKIIQ